MISAAKIVIDARELRTSTGRYVERLLHYLQQIDSPYQFTVLLKPQDMAGWTPTNPSFVKLACPYKEFSLDEQFGMLEQLHHLRPDLVHFAMTQQPVLYRGRAVTTIHDLTTLRFRNPTKNPLVFIFKQNIYKLVTKYVAHKSVRIITPTEFVKHDVVQYTGIASGKVTVTLEAADRIAATPTPLPELTNKEFILYVGRPQPHKNLWRLVEAFQLLQATHPSLQLVLAGKTDDAYRHIAARVAATGTPRVIFTGFIDDSQLRWLYEHCTAYVFPSLSEGFGLPGLEAMAHGAPVASSNATCLPEVNGQAARYFDPQKPTDIARAVADIIDKPDVRTNLVAAGHQQVGRYSWQRMAEQTLAVYAQALNHSKSLSTKD